MLSFVFLSFLGSCSHDLNPPFGTFLKRECNSFALSNWYFIRLSGGGLFSRQSLADCSQHPLIAIGDLFNSVPCSSGQWRIMNVSCEYGSKQTIPPAVLLSPRQHLTSATVSFSSAGLFLKWKMLWFSSQDLLIQKEMIF